MAKQTDRPERLFTRPAPWKSASALPENAHGATSAESGFRQLHWGLSALGAIATHLLLASSLNAQVKKPPIPPRETPVTRTAAPISRGGHEVAQTARFAHISGTVSDSLSHEPLKGAIIQFAPAADPSRIRSASTDSTGFYAIDSLPTGTYLVGLLHDRVDQLGLDGMAIQVRIADTGRVELPLGLPSAASYMALKCPGNSAESGTGVFSGRVRSSSGRSLEGQARVRVQYTETTVSAGGIERRRPLRITDASSTGAFTVCGLPTGTAITTRAYSGPDSSGVVELAIPSTGVLTRDMYVGSATRVTVKRDNFSPAETMLRGNLRLRGIVRDSAGRPLRGARVVLPGSGAESVTGSGGQFQLDSVPGGTWMLEARAVGFEPRRTTVDVTSETQNDLATDIALDAATVRVDTVKVQADKWTQQMAAFEARKKMGFGHFYDEAAIEKRDARTIADFLRSTPGVSINPGMNGRDQVTMRGVSGGGKCIPLFFVDGVRVQVLDGVIDNAVNQADVRAIEVYPGTGGTPIEFMNRDGCGSVVIWTGGRRPPAKG